MCRLVEGHTGRASLPRMRVFADAHVRERGEISEYSEASELSEGAKMADGTKKTVPPSSHDDEGTSS
jgi:hypothetical protein